MIRVKSRRNRLKFSLVFATAFFIASLFFLPPIGLFIGICAFFGIRGDYKRQKENFRRLQTLRLETDEDRREVGIPNGGIKNLSCPGV